MKHPGKLDKIAQLKNEFKARAGRDLLNARQRQQASLAQHQRLLEYRREYREQMKKSMAGSLKASEIQEFRNFLAFLEKAIDEQGQELRRAEAGVTAAQGHWLEKAREVDKIKLAMDKRDRMARHGEERLEQARTDEHNQQRHARNNRAVPGDS